LRVIRRLLSHHLGKYKILKDEEIEFIADTSPGYPYGCKYKTKEAAFRAHPKYFKAYLAPGAERIPPIYKVTPKVEYMTKEELGEEKIRLFRNPPLDLFLLESKYFADMDAGLSKLDFSTKIGLGFVKEHGGWDSFIKILMKHPFFLMYDIGTFDKGFGPSLLKAVYDLRQEFYDKTQDINEEDWNFLYYSMAYAMELVYNGQVYHTSCGGKSGNLTTSTNNTLAHMLIIIYHITGHFETDDAVYKFMVKQWEALLYSDDNCSSTSMPEVFSEKSLDASFKCFGMRVKDFVLSPDPTKINFLGATNMRFKNYWVPRYKEDRMVFATAYLGGSVTDDIRAQRVCGLAKKLGFY